MKRIFNRTNYEYGKEAINHIFSKCMFPTSVENRRTMEKKNKKR